MGNTHSDNSENVLYLGMSADIYTPLVLCPNFTTLYVIDKSEIIDKYGNDDPTSIREDIMEYLTSGKYVKYGDYRELKVKLPPVKDFKVKLSNSQKWVVEFIYNDLPRKLIIYSQDYFKPWPADITNISTILTLGAPFALNPNDKYDGTVNKVNIKNTRNMINERTTPVFRYIMGDNYSRSSIFRKFTLKGTKIFEVIVDKNNPIYPYVLDVLTIEH